MVIEMTVIMTLVMVIVIMTTVVMMVVANEAAEYPRCVRTVRVLHKHHLISPH